MEEIMLKRCIGFDWDEGNSEKNQYKHNVSMNECEQVFFNEPLLVYEDLKHSDAEWRMFVLGKTDEARELFVVITIRNQRIRVISARDMSRKEREVYAQA